jgi:hypothetical protein
VDGRAERLAAWGGAHGLAPAEEDEGDLSLLPFRTVSGVVDREIDHVLEGTWEDADVATFDLRRGSGSVGQVLTCALTAVPYGFPPLLIANRRAPVDFESLLALPIWDAAPAELADPLEIRSADPEFAQTLVTGRLAGWLAEWSSRTPFLGFELVQSWLLDFAPELEPEQLPDLLDGLLSFRDRIPDGVFDRYPMPARRAEEPP